MADFRLHQFPQQILRRNLCSRRHLVGAALLRFFGHGISVAFCCLLPPFWRPSKTPVPALKRCELVGVFAVAFFEAFAKRPDIGVSSLSALQTDAARHPFAVRTGHYPTSCLRGRSNRLRKAREVPG